MSSLSARTLRIALAGSLLLSAGAVAIATAALLRKPPPVDQLTVQRLDIVEPDGTPRMIISSRARFPGSFFLGKEIARPDRRDHAGILFVNDEGTENGGLIQAGKLDQNGRTEAGLSLTFDRFRQDQVLQLLHSETDGQVDTGIIIGERPSHEVFSIDQIMQLAQHDAPTLAPAEREALLNRHRDQGHFGFRRAFLGTQQGAATLILRDARGRPRLQLVVSPTGEPALQLLDEHGAVVRTIDTRTPQGSR